MTPKEITQFKKNALKKNPYRILSHKNRPVPTLMRPKPEIFQRDFTSVPALRYVNDSKEVFNNSSLLTGEFQAVDQALHRVVITEPATRVPETGVNNVPPHLPAHVGHHPTVCKMTQTSAEQGCGIGEDAASILKKYGHTLKVLRSAGKERYLNIVTVDVPAIEPVTYLPISDDLESTDEDEDVTIRPRHNYQKIQNQYDRKSHVQYIKKSNDVLDGHCKIMLECADALNEDFSTSHEVGHYYKPKEELVSQTTNS